MSDRKCAASRTLVLEPARTAQPVPGVGGQQLEGGDLVVFDRASGAGPAHERGGELPLDPHGGGDHGAEPIGAQLGQAAGAFVVVVDDNGPALVEYERDHAPIRAVDRLDVGLGEPTRVHDPVAAAVVDEFADVGGLEPELDDGVDRPGQDGVLIERVELTPEARHPAPQTGTVLVLDGGALTEHELSGELHRDQVGGSCRGQDHAQAQDQGGGADLPACSGERRRICDHSEHGQGDAAPARVRDVRHEQALQEIDEIEVGVAAAGEVDADRNERDVEERPDIEQR